MFRIMTAVSKRDNSETLYKFLTTTVDNVTKPLEMKDRTELDAKDDFIIVSVTDYKIDARDYGGGE